MLQIIDKIRRRPGLFIGYHSPTHLDSFLSGVAFNQIADTNQVDNFDFIQFSDWIADKLGYTESTSGWARMIEDQREDKEEALWLFFELLDEFRGISHRIIKTVNYSNLTAIPDINFYTHRPRQMVVNSHDLKPKPHILIIRKLDLEEEWYSLVAFDESGTVLHVNNADNLFLALKMANDIYGVDQEDW